MTSASSLGGSTVTVQFDLSRNVNDAARDVQAAINAAARDLPANLPNPPTYRKYNPADSPVVVLAMTSQTMRLSEVYNLADQSVSQRLCQLPGVSQVHFNFRIGKVADILPTRRPVTADDSRARPGTQDLPPVLPHLWRGVRPVNRCIAALAPPCPRLRNGQRPLLRGGGCTVQVPVADAWHGET